MIVTEKQMKICKLIVEENLTNAVIGERLGNTRGGIEQILVKLYRRHKVLNRNTIKNYISQFQVKDLRRKRGQI